METLDQNINEVYSIFKHIGSNVAFPFDKKSIAKQLSDGSGNYHSLAFESASHEISQQEVKVSNSLTEWREFYKRHSSHHGIHILIGLGWTLAKTKNIQTLKHFSEGERWLISDGAGYFDALFRYNKTIVEKTIPVYIQNNDIHGYHQGIGRQLFYRHLGNYTSINNEILNFEKEQEKHLWCGVGIAAGYVGGAKINEIAKMKEAGGPSFLLGFILGKTNRFKMEQFRDIDLIEWESLELNSIETLIERVDQFYHNTIRSSKTRFYIELNLITREIDIFNQN